MLSEQRRQQLDGITKQMVMNKEKDNDIQFVVNDFIKKYGNEQTQTEKPKQDLISKTAGVLGKIFPGKQIGEAIGTQIAKITVPKEQKEFVAKGPTAMQIAGDVANVGLNIAGLKGVGTAGNFASRLLKTAGLGAGLAGTKTISEGGGAKEVAKSTALGGAVGAAVPIVGAGLSAIGKQISQLPSRFINSALSRSKAEILKDISNDKVDDFAKYVSQSKNPLKTSASHLKESQDAVETLGNKISVSLESAIRQTGLKKTIGTNNFLDQIAKLPEAEGALLKRADIKGIVEKLAPQTKKLLSKPSLTLTEANKLRQLADKTLGDRAFLGGQLTSDKIILKKFADNLREMVKQKAPEGTRALFSELSNEIRFRDGLLERVAKRGGNQVLSFGDFIGGGLGGVFGGGVGGAVAGVAARRAIESVPFKLTSAKVINALTTAAPKLEGLTPAQQTIILDLFADLFSPDQDMQK